jgi:hypothetical protein
VSTRAGEGGGELAAALRPAALRLAADERGAVRHTVRIAGAAAVPGAGVSRVGRLVTSTFAHALLVRLTGDGLMMGDGGVKGDGRRW